MKNKVSIYIQNRGYSVDVIEDSPEYNMQDITVLGNYSKSNYNATCIVSIYGISPTVRENHGQLTGILEERQK